MMQEKDRGWNRIKRSMQDTGYTKVGYPMEDPRASGIHDKSRLTVGEIAGVHEFGSKKMGIPARPHLAPAFDDNLKNLQELSRKLDGAVLDGKMERKQALGILGEVHKGQIQQTIRNMKVPKLSERTIRQKTRAGKRGDALLIDTGQMINTITHVEVV